MNKEFDNRWQALTAQARKAGGISPSEPPPGFCTRVLAHCADRTATESFEEIVSAFGMRALIFTLFVSLVCGGIFLSEWYTPRIEQPSLEQTLTELIWP